MPKSASVSHTRLVAFFVFFDSPASFVVGELTFIALAALALVHARTSGRDHLLVWVGALIAGTANDMIFMALPLVDNFWQALFIIIYQ